MSLLRKLRNFRKNISYLFRHKLEDKEKELKYFAADIAEDTYLYKIKNDNNFGKEKYLKVCSKEETVEMLLNNPKSFCRFGDGEVLIMMGNDIAFQKYDKSLADSLKKLLVIIIMIYILA